MLNSIFKAALGFGVAVLVPLACCFPIDFDQLGGSDEPSDSETWQEEVDEIRGMTRGQSIPRHLTDPEQPATGEVFDPNRLLEPLDHLQLRDGYTLDFVYNYDGMGGRPYLYAREESAEPFENYEAFQAALDACRLAEEPVDCDYLDFIEGDGTEEGYFQWVLLKMMGAQFYLYWHSGYNDAEIVASHARLSDLVEDLSGDQVGFPLSSALRRQALRIDPVPAVTIRDDEVIVRIVWFTKWGGFYERTIRLTPTAPYQLIELQDEELVPYDCGIMF